MLSSFFSVSHNSNLLLTDQFLPAIRCIIFSKYNFSTFRTYRLLNFAIVRHRTLEIKRCINNSVLILGFCFCYVCVCVCVCACVRVNWCVRVSVFATNVLLVFIITITISFGLRPPSSGTNIEYTNGNIAKLTTDPLLEHHEYNSKKEKQMIQHRILC
jgi:hypothetical protein